MKKIWGLGVVATFTCGLGLTQFACSGETQGSALAEPTADPKLEELIGSVPVSSASLDAIGSIGYVYDYGIGAGTGGSASTAGSSRAASAGAPVSFGGSGGSSPYPSSYYAQCTGTLISKNSVLTSRSCGQLLQQLYYSASLKFAIGADSTQPKRLVDVVDVEFAPADTSSGGFSYPDIAVLHLGESITDVTPFPVTLLTDDLIGKQLAAVGFGTSDLRYSSGTRRAGAVTLKATSGLLYPAIFGSFDAFYQYELNAGYYPYPPPYGTGGMSNLAQPDAASRGGGMTNSAGAGGASGASGNMSGGASESAGSGGGGDDWFRQYLQQQYDSTALGTGEAYLGGTDADAQPCGADQGGPIVRKLHNEVRVFGVFSRTPFGGCERGGIYVGITAATKTFIDAAAQWKDPCLGITANGSCVGSTVTRCSTAFEGKRRPVKFDCSLLDQVCVGGGTSEAACTDK